MKQIALVLLLTLVFGSSNAPQAQGRPSTRDSVRNGALIGAVVGAVSGFALGMWYCHAVREEGDPGCFPGAFAFGGIGAGAGAAAGAGIDAAMMRRHAIAFSFRF